MTSKHFGQTTLDGDFYEGHRTFRMVSAHIFDTSSIILKIFIYFIILKKSCKKVDEWREYKKYG